MCFPSIQFEMEKWKVGPIGRCTTVNPLGRFLKSYVVHRYFLCGLPGLIYAAMLGQYAFLTEAELYRLGLRDGSAGEAE